MSPFIKQLAEELGKDVKELEKVWMDAKKVTAETFGIEEEDFSKREIEYTKEVVREALGLKREITVSDFINSDKSAREFLDEAVQSSDSFGIDGPIQKKDKDDDEEDLEEAKKDGTAPDGTGPHGKGDGPGKGKADGSGMKNNDEEDDDKDDEKNEEKKINKKSTEEVLTEALEYGTKVKITYKSMGGARGELDTAFDGLTGTVQGQEDGYYRVKLDNPPFIKSLGYAVTDDLWQRQFLKVIR